MPLAGHISVVAGIGHKLRQRGGALIEVALVTGATLQKIRQHFGHPSKADNVVVHTRHEHRPRRRTVRARIEIREHHSIPHQRIYIRRLDLAAKKTEIVQTQVVNDNQQNVGARISLTDWIGTPIAAAATR